MTKQFYSLINAHRGACTSTPRDTYKNVQVALLVIYENWKQPQYPLAIYWINIILVKPNSGNIHAKI